MRLTVSLAAGLTVALACIPSTSSAQQKDLVAAACPRVLLAGPCMVRCYSAVDACVERRAGRKIQRSEQTWLPVLTGTRTRGSTAWCRGAWRALTLQYP